VCDHDYAPGDLIRLCADPARFGVFDGVDERQGRRFAWLRTPMGRSRIPLDQVERVPSALETPVALLRRDVLSDPARLRQVLAHIRLTGRLSDMVYSLEATNTDFHAHQFKPVLKMLGSPTGALLIADEVGLGKTIEAGLVWTELRARFDYRRLLVVCPKVLCDKWRAELTDKFDLDARILSAGDLLTLLETPADFDRGFVAVASLQGLRPPKGWRDAESEGGGRAAARLARLLSDRAEDDPLFDMVVFDEAHHLRNPETQSNAGARLLRATAQHLLFLSATPIHLRNRDLFSLLTLIDPETFHDETALEDIIAANERLVHAREAILRGADVAQAREAVAAAARHPLLKDLQQVAAITDTLARAQDPWDRAARAQIAARLEQANLLANLVNRTRRRDVQELRVIRQVTAHKADMTPRERSVYDRITMEVARYAAEVGMPPAFLKAGPQRLLASSIPAALEHWRGGADFDLEDSEVDDEGDAVADRADEARPLVSRLRIAAAQEPSPQEMAREDTKYATLLAALRDTARDAPGQKVILFSSFRATLTYLAQRLRADGVPVAVMHGGTTGRTGLIATFASSPDIRVLLSSEVGSEGVDLQFSRVIVNYDLPWNPMRVEQRIGRVDRMGQEADTVSVLNLMHRDTIDDIIYDRLYDRLRLCERALGGFEALLGREIGRLSPDLLLGRLTPEETAARLDQSAQAVANRMREEEELELEAAALIAHGDTILRAIEDARDLNRWIGARDLADYLEAGLTALFPGSRLHQGETADLFQIRLSPEARSAYAAWLDRNKVREGRRLLRDDGPLRCRLGRPAKAARGIEAMPQTHPLVRFVAAQIAESEAPKLRPAVAARVAVSALPASVDVAPGHYVTVAALWRFSGAFMQERIAYVGLSHPEGAPLSADAAEALTLTAASQGAPWRDAGLVLDMATVADRCEGALFDALAERFQDAEQARRAEAEDRAAIQLQTLARRLAQQRGDLIDLIDRQRRRATDEGDARAGKAAALNEAKLRKLDDRAAIRRQRIETTRAFTAEEEHLAVAVIEVTP